MTEKLRKLTDLFDTQAEVLAWVIVVLAVIFEIRGFEDLYTVAMLAVAAGIMGYVRKVRAGSAELSIGPRNE